MASIASGWKNLTTFLTETRSEIKKVTFPSRKEVVATTIVVLIASFVFSFYLWVADIVILRVYQGVLRIFSP